MWETVCLSSYVLDKGLSPQPYFALPYLTCFALEQGVPTGKSLVFDPSKGTNIMIKIMHLKL